MEDEEEETIRVHRAYLQRKTYGGSLTIEIEYVLRSRGTSSGLLKEKQLNLTITIAVPLLQLLASQELYERCLSLFHV